MTPEIAAKLRAPFPPESVGKLPRITCKDCRDRKGTCDKHKVRVKCRECGNFITTAHLHLDYVGHAEITDRLLMVDPMWTWEPVAFSADGLPAMGHGGLWIRLTVAGVTRLGFGHADGKTGPDAVKEAIGDALRNAAMRFGVGLDLWGATYKGGENTAHEENDEQQEVTTQMIEQDATYDLFNEELTAAETEATITEIGARVRTARAADRISPMQYERLARRAGERLANFALLQVAA